MALFYSYISENKETNNVKQLSNLILIFSLLDNTLGVCFLILYLRDMFSKIAVSYTHLDVYKRQMNTVSRTNLVREFLKVKTKLVKQLQ